jgi:hypothetical protein
MEQPSTPVSTRRKFIDYFLGTSLGATFVATVYPIFKFLVPPQITESTESSVVAAKVSELKPNSGKIF